MSEKLEQWLEDVIDKNIENLIDIDGGDEAAECYSWAEFSVAFYVLTHLRDGAPLPGWDKKHPLVLNSDGRAEQYAKLHGVDGDGWEPAEEVE